MRLKSKHPAGLYKYDASNVLVNISYSGWKAVQPESSNSNRSFLNCRECVQQERCTQPTDSPSCFLVCEYLPCMQADLFTGEVSYLYSQTKKHSESKIAQESNYSCSLFLLESIFGLFVQWLGRCLFKSLRRVRFSHRLPTPAAQAVCLRQKICEVLAPKKLGVSNSLKLLSP